MFNSIIFLIRARERGSQIQIVVGSFMPREFSTDGYQLSLIKYKVGHIYSLHKFSLQFLIISLTRFGMQKIKVWENPKKATLFSSIVSLISNEKAMTRTFLFFVTLDIKISL